MQTERLARLRQLEESAEDPVRADLKSQRPSECWGSYRAPVDDFQNIELWQNLEMWRRVLAAYTQPLPGAAD